MHAVEAHQQRVWVRGQVLHVLGHDLSQQHAFFLCLCLDHVAAVVRVKEELACGVSSVRDNVIKMVRKILIFDYRLGLILVQPKYTRQYSEYRTH